jgi:hypothetical protein
MVIIYRQWTHLIYCCVDHHTRGAVRSLMKRRNVASGQFENWLVPHNSKFVFRQATNWLPGWRLSILQHQPVAVLLNDILDRDRQLATCVEAAFPRCDDTVTMYQTSATVHNASFADPELGTQDRLLPRIHRR